MPRFLINLATQRNQVFELKGGEYLIGRDKDAAIQLPNVSVSRRHARVLMDKDAVVVEDLESGNGTTVNGKAITRHTLESKDELRIGKFSLVYLTDQKKDEFYKGRCVKYLPTWEPRAGGDEPVETFVLSKDALKAMQKQSRLVEDARIVLERDATRFWHPEDRSLTFGTDAALIHPAGWYVWGTVAEIAWDGNHHVLHKRAFWVPVTVNERGVQTQVLRNGDRIRIADSRFRYDAG